MDYVHTTNGLRLLGMGQASVIEVKSGSTDVHQVRVYHPDFGETAFIPYIQTAGLLKVPAIGDIVYVFCNEGFHNYPMAWGNKLHDSAVKALLGNRDNKATVIYSTGADHKTISHTIILDDGAERGIRVKTAGGNQIELKNDTDISITQVDGNTINLGKSGITLTAGGASISLTKDSITLTAGGSEITLGSKVDIKAADGLSTVDGVVVKTHKHTGNAGYPTSAPIP